MLEPVGRRRAGRPRRYRRSDSARRSSAACRRPGSKPATASQERVGEVAAEHRADLRDLPRLAKPVEARRERLLQGRRDGLHAASRAALEKQARHLLDEQRHAAGALADAVDHLGGQGMARGDLADHAPHLRAVERRKRNDAVVRAQAPGRAEFRPGRRDDEQRRLRAALGQRPQEIERGRIGPVQVLEGEHDRLRSGACEKPGRHRRQLPASQFLRREFRRAVLGQRDVEQRREQGRIFCRVETDLRRVFSRSASRCSSGASGPPKRSRPHSATGCSGVFCNSCDDDHSTQVCGVSPSRARNSSISRDLPKPGSPTISDELALACARAPSGG